MIIDDASIRVHIKSKPCSRATAVVSSTRTNAVARAASLPENRGKVRRMLTLLYGLCPLAHLAAFEGALSAARGEDEKLDGSKLERQRLLADAVRLEGLTENLRVLLLEASRLELESEALNVMPGDLPPAPSLEPVDARAVGRLRAVLSQAASALLKLPMSSTWSETEHNLAQRTRAELSASMNAAAAIAQTSLWGMPPEDFCSLVEKPDDEAAAAIMQWAKTYAAKLPTCLPPCSPALKRLTRGPSRNPKFRRSRITPRSKGRPSAKSSATACSMTRVLTLRLSGRARRGSPVPQHGFGTTRLWRGSSAASAASPQY